MIAPVWFLIFVSALGLVSLCWYLLRKSSNPSWEFSSGGLLVLILVCIFAAFALTVDLQRFFPDAVATPQPIPGYAAGSEPSASQFTELPVIDYAEVLSRSEEFDGQEIRVAGRIAEVSSDRHNPRSILFRERLFSYFGQGFEVRLLGDMPEEKTVGDYYNQGQYILVQGRWSRYSRRLSGNVISTGEDAKQAAKVFEDAWEAEGRGYAETLPLTDYMDIADSARNYRNQRVRTGGQICLLEENLETQNAVFSFIDPQSGGACLSVYLQGCPPEMQAACMEGEYVILSGIVQGSGDQTIRECFVEYVGDEAVPLLDQVRTARQERLKAEREAYFASCQEYAYEDLARYPDAYGGKNILLQGTILQIRVDKLDDHFLLDMGDGHIVYVSYYGKLPGDPEILEGDQVTFYGKCSGRTSYDTPMGETKTIPWVVANYSSFNHFDDP